MECNYYSPCPLYDINCVTPEQMCEDMSVRLKNNWRLLALCGVPQQLFIPRGTGVGLLCILIHDATATCHILRTEALTQYESFTLTCPQAHLFEREIYEQFGIMPQGHPWLKPVRFTTPATGAPRPLPGDTTYFKVDGSTVHEVAVGPIHAGVIEPGHFRFQCYGEIVMYLETGLGFQHRDVENLLQQSPRKHWSRIIECAAGDTSIAHTTAYAQLCEKLTHSIISPHAQSIRAIALELERLACHTGDLGAMGGDVGFLPTSSWCGRIRGDFLNMTGLLCGNRFGRGLVCPGGVTYELDGARKDALLQRLDAAYADVCGAIDVMLQHHAVLDRFEDTGVVSKAIAQDLGMVGMAARASGLAQDARLHYQDASLFPSPCAIRTQNTGDVLARAKVRRMEVDDAVRIIRHLCQNMDDTQPAKVAVSEGDTTPHLAVACVEGWRGAVSHIAISNDAGALPFYKIIDPSFHNWAGLAMALRSGEISDFPLCNKSFNLSYCGHDL